jgi:hypothetical protein
MITAKKVFLAKRGIRNSKSVLALLNTKPVDGFTKGR